MSRRSVVRSSSSRSGSGLVLVLRLGAVGNASVANRTTVGRAALHAATPMPEIVAHLVCRELLSLTCSRVQHSLYVVCIGRYLDADCNSGPDKREHQGGYSTHVRAQERFVFPIPDEIPSVEAASM